MNLIKLGENMFNIKGNNVGNNEITINTIFMFLILFYDSILKIISDFIRIDGLLGYIFLLAAGAVLIFGRVKLDKVVIGSYFILVFLLLCNMLFYYNNQQFIYLFNLFSFGLVGILGSLCHINYSKLYFYGTIYGLFWVLYNIATNFVYAIEDSFSFGFIMLPIVFSIMSLIMSIQSIRMKMLLYPFLIYTVIISLQYSGRGALINIIIFILLSLITSKKKHYKILSFLLFLSSIVLVANLENILWYIHKNSSIKFDAIEDTLYLLGQGDITNGRSNIYLEAISSFSGFDIIFGNGIGLFQDINGSYTHNVFLSILLDFGLVGLVIFITIFVNFIRRLISTQNKSKQNFMTIVFCLSIIKLMFSGDYWTSVSFFIFLGMAVGNKLKIGEFYDQHERRL